MQFELFIHQCADPGGPSNQSINQSAVSNFSPGSDEPLFDWCLTFCFQASTNQLRRRVCSLVFAAPKPDHLQQAHHATGLSTVSRSVVFLCFLVCESSFRVRCGSAAAWRQFSRGLWCSDELRTCARRRRKPSVPGQ